MGGGSWTTQSYATYTTNSKGVDLDCFRTLNYSAQELYKATNLSDKLNPKNVMRECCDSDEHPNTLPVILALDVTGSMGDAAVKVSQKLGDIMTSIYNDDTIKDVEFCVMGIGDLYCDNAPVQISQFESDVRIAEQLDELYFEGGGGGNSFESYTAAWYMGINHCKLDCWNRGKKGIIITLGDELPNPYLPKEGRRTTFEHCIGDRLQDNIQTEDLIKETLEKFNVYHISIDDSSSCYRMHNHSGSVDSQWKELIGSQNYFVANLDNLSDTIVDIISNYNSIVSNTNLSTNIENSSVNENGEITW